MVQWQNRSSLQTPRAVRYASARKAECEGSKHVAQIRHVLSLWLCFRGFRAQLLGARSRAERRRASSSLVTESGRQAKNFIIIRRRRSTPIRG